MAQLEHFEEAAPKAKAKAKAEAKAEPKAEPKAKAKAEDTAKPETTAKVKHGVEQIDNNDKKKWKNVIQV